MRDRVVSGLGNGLGLGLGMGIALGVSTVIGGGLRPLAKGAIKGSLWAKDHLTLLSAEARERAEDVYHEARSERAADRALLDGEGVTLVRSPRATSREDAAGDLP